MRTVGWAQVTDKRKAWLPFDGTLDVWVILLITGVLPIPLAVSVLLELCYLVRFTWSGLHLNSLAERVLLLLPKTSFPPFRKVHPPNIFLCFCWALRANFSSSLQYASTDNQYSTLNTVSVPTSPTKIPSRPNNECSSSRLCLCFHLQALPDL